MKDQHGRVFYDKLTFIYMEMLKFKKSIDELETQADKWQYIFNNLDRLRKQPPEIKEKVFQQLFDAAEVAKFGKAERMQYEQSLKQYRDLNNVLDYAEQNGRQRGYELGVQEGIQQQTIQIARNALAKGLTIAQVADLTGLSEADIQSL